MESKTGGRGEGGLRTRVLVLSDLVDYQEGAVVSREVVRGNAGTVSVFAFDTGEGLSEHTAPFDAMVSVLEGEAEVVISGTASRSPGARL